MFLILISFLLIINLKSSISQLNVNSALMCDIPNQQNQGKCKRAENCLKYVQLKQQEPHNFGKFMFLRKIQCSNAETDESLICCPNDGEIYRDPTIQIDVQAKRKRWQRPSNINDGINTSDAHPYVLFESRFGDENENSLLPKKCGQQFGNRINGGEIADIDEFPWSALIVYNATGTNMYGCGGTLISERYVLTAAHCVSGISYRRRGGLKAVRLGEYDTQNKIDCIYDNGTPDCADEAIDITYDEIIVHSMYISYSNDQHHDIALIRLSHNIKFTDFIRPICLPKKNSDNGLTNGNRLSIAGWGRTDLYSEKYGDILSPIKLKLRIPFVDHENCTEAYRAQYLRLGMGQVCAGGERGKDSCPGDSGGALMNFDRTSFRWVLSGIVSLGLELCGTEKVPGVYTRVDYYLDWIMDNIKP